MSTLDTILSFLQGKGLTPAQAAGVAGNLQVESGFNPEAYNPREGAIGLAQWEKGRRTNLQNYARATGGSETNLLTQLNFLWSEFQGPESGALARLKATNDAGTAAAVFDQYYERSAGTSRSTRIQNAQAIAGGLGRGKDTDGNLSPYTAVDTPGQALDAGKDVLAGVLPDWGPLALKLAATTVAGALVVVGLTRTVSK